MTWSMSKRDVGVRPIAADLERPGAVVEDLGREPQQLAPARRPGDAQVADRGRTAGPAAGRWRRRPAWPARTPIRRATRARTTPRRRSVGRSGAPDSLDPTLHVGSASRTTDGSVARRRSSALPASRRRSCCDEQPLAQPDRLRRDLDQLVDRDELDRGLERERPRRRQPQRLVVGVGPDVGELLLLGRVDVHVARAGCSRRRSCPRRPRRPAPMNSSARSWRLNSP